MKRRFRFLGAVEEGEEVSRALDRDVPRDRGLVSRPRWLAVSSESPSELNTSEIRIESLIALPKSPEPRQGIRISSWLAPAQRLPRRGLVPRPRPPGRPWRQRRGPFV